MIVIFGGTGTLGYALARIFAESKNQVTIISRCELKQKQMAQVFPDFNYIVGDVRDHHWKHMVKPTEVYNLAAMKHVDTAEFNTEFCYDVNVNGTINTCKWALDHGANYNFSSTDKAVLPINAYGASKMAAEKYVLSMGCNVYRWGNICGSRGSVLHIFKKTLISQNKVYITHPEMTRFLMHIDDAAHFMVEKAIHTTGTWIPEMGACKITDLARGVAYHLGIDNFEVEFTGIRPGEKIHEVLESNHDWCYRSDDPKIQMNDEQLFNLIGRAMDA